MPEGAAKGKKLEPGHQYLTEVVPLGSLNQLFTCRNTCLLRSGAGGLGSCWCVNIHVMCREGGLLGMCAEGWARGECDHVDVNSSICVRLCMGPPAPPTSLL